MNIVVRKYYGEEKKKNTDEEDWKKEEEVRKTLPDEEELGRKWEDHEDTDLQGLSEESPQSPRSSWAIVGES